MIHFWSACFGGLFWSLFRFLIYGLSCLSSDIKSGDLSSDCTFLPSGHWTVHSCAISTPRRAYIPAAFSANWTHCRSTHCYLCPTRYSFSPESSEVPCPRFPIKSMSQYWEGRNMIFLWKSCSRRGSKPHGSQRHRQSATVYPLRHVPLTYACHVVHLCAMGRQIWWNRL